MTRAGYIKAVAASTYRTQGRGTRGMRGTNLREADIVAKVIHTTAHAYLLFFSNLGRVYRLRAFEVPAAGAHRPRYGHRQPSPVGTRTNGSRPLSTPASSIRQVPVVRHQTGPCEEDGLL